MIKSQYINLDMVPSGVLPVLYSSQYDIGRPLGLVVYNGSEVVDLSTYTCTIEATRTDGTAITAAVTTDENIGAFVTTATMTNQADKYLAKLILFDSQSRRVASLAFVMCITSATMDENAEGIEEDRSLYQQYTEAVQTLIAEIREDIVALESRADALDAALDAEITERKAEDDLRIPYAKVQTPIKAQLTKIFDGPHQDYIHQGFAYDGEYYYFARYKTATDPVILSKINATTGTETSVTTSYVCHANAISIIDDKLYITGNDNNLLMVYDKNLNFVKEIQTPNSVYAFDRSTSNTNVCIYGISATESFAVCVLTDGKLQVVGGVTGTRIPATNKQGIFVGSYIYQLLSRYGKNPGHIRIITMFGIEYGDIVFDFDDTGIEFEDLTKINNYFWISDSKGNVYKTDDLTGKLSHLFTLSPFTPPNFGMNYSPVATKITPSNGLCNATFYASGSNYILKSFVIPNQVINRTCFAPRVIFEADANRVADGYIDVQGDKRLTVTMTYLATNSLVTINARYLYDAATNTFAFDESYFRAIVKDLVNASSTPTVYTDINAFVGAGNSLTVRSFAAQSLYYHNTGIQAL